MTVRPWIGRSSHLWTKCAILWGTKNEGPHRFNGRPCGRTPVVEAFNLSESTPTKGSANYVIQLQVDLDMQDFLPPPLPRSWHVLVYGFGAMSGGVERKPVPRPIKARIKAEQQDRCAYCDMVVGGWVARGARPVRLMEHWDHFDPYEYIRANPSSNWVMACHICNGMKGKKCFPTMRAAREYIQQRRQVLAVNGQAIRWLGTHEEWLAGLGVRVPAGQAPTWRHLHRRRKVAAT